MKHLILTLMFAATITLSGCTTFKKITGQTDDTVLPGQRETILPPDQSTARDPQVTGKQAKPCDPKLEQCPPSDLAPAEDLPPEDTSSGDAATQ